LLADSPKLDGIAHNPSSEVLFCKAGKVTYEACRKGNCDGFYDLKNSAASAD
jgi:hypothetical protein